ncbi:MAG: acetate--CoA ligase family protein [Actinomycetia bacterium]|nr:acetate--CoA ligase family protein [Actinomycetes bacterium]
MAIPQIAGDDETGDMEKGLRPALDGFSSPRAIAVVGASSDPTTIAGLLFANLVDSGFGGVVLPINPHHTEVRGIRAYADLASCPTTPDLVVVCVPADAVIDVVAQAGDFGVGAVCVISAGFAEVGPQGAARQARLVATARERGVRLVGPNCTGILGGVGEGRFNATFSRTLPAAGGAFLLSQSGAVGLAVLEAADARGLGIGAFVSIGNAADVSTNDLLRYWEDESAADVILLYLESIPGPASFLRVAQRLGRRVPIVAVKAGRTVAGRRGAASHTAALSGGDVGVDALLHQAGVIRAGSIDEMLDLATMLSCTRRYSGRRVAIVTNGGGPGILAADACEANGLEVPELAASTAAQLRALLAPEASVANPVDMIASATAAQYGQVTRIVGAESDVDAVMVLFNTPLITRAVEVADEMIAARAVLADDVALVGVFMNRDGAPATLHAAGIASFTSPENASRALARAIAWDERRRRPEGTIPRPAFDVAQARRIVNTAASTGEGWLDTVTVAALLDACGIASVRSRLVSTPEEAEQAQIDFGGTVVIKAAAAIHKSDVGGVRTGITTALDAAAAVRAIRLALVDAGLPDAADKFLVQEQISSGLEMIVGVNRDPLVGPLVVVGRGGTAVEVLNDVAVRVAPLTDHDVDEMVETLRSYPLLTGYRGAAALDVAALRDVLHRISTLVAEIPEIAEIDLNPIFVLEHGVAIADARIRRT